MVAADAVNSKEYEVEGPVCFGRRAFLFWRTLVDLVCCEGCETVGDVLGSGGMCLDPGGFCHCCQLCRRGKESRQRIEELAGNVQIALNEEDCGAGIDHGFSI